jgi:hypothetical protein
LRLPLHPKGCRACVLLTFIQFVKWTGGRNSREGAAPLPGVDSQVPGNRDYLDLGGELVEAFAREARFIIFCRIGCASRLSSGASNACEGPPYLRGASDLRVPPKVKA